MRVQDFEDSDLILAMVEDNPAGLKRMEPKAGRAHPRLFFDYAPETGQTDVPDPYYTRDFGCALDLIERASDGLIASLAS